MDEQRTEKHEKARSSLPEELRHCFDDLVNDYRFAATKIYGRPYVAYDVLAEIIRLGWRIAAEPINEQGAKPDAG